jgi:hypothetical protein
MEDSSSVTVNQASILSRPFYSRRELAEILCRQPCSIRRLERKGILTPVAGFTKPLLYRAADVAKLLGIPDESPR